MNSPKEDNYHTVSISSGPAIMFIKAERHNKIIKQNQDEAEAKVPEEKEPVAIKILMSKFATDLGGSKNVVFLKD